ncbi:MAG: hypothetical protein KIS92_15135 [Planctomycetota bacterium]|nr:hypothetical protein [Planctomycetota bacterium]
MNPRPWSVLVSGLCSVGKSSVVCALWGDADLAPSAVRDCTQTNTQIRMPADGEADRTLRVEYLTRDRALAYALGDLSFYRLSQLILEVLGPAGPRLDEGPPEDRLRDCLAAVKKIFAERPDIAVLQEPLSDEVEKLEQFLAFLDAPAYQAGQTVVLDWARRREELMGKRREDGRTVDVGHLLSYRHVELLRASEHWPAQSDALAAAPVLVDSPWIPTFHNARRADLILEQARSADVLVLISLPDRFTPEPWVEAAFKRRPELARRTVVLFNQVDTVDIPQLFARGGFAEAFDETARSLRNLGIQEENLLISCARLPFLRLAAQDDLVRERIAKLEAVLKRVRKQCELRKESAFLKRLLAACDPADCGIETLRTHLRRMVPAPAPF